MKRKRPFKKESRLKRKRSFKSLVREAEDRKARRIEKSAENAALKASAAPQDEPGAVERPSDSPRQPDPRKSKPRRKKSPTLSKLKKGLWGEISLLVRSWSDMCLACRSKPTECAAHIVPSHEGAATRFFLPNLYPCCHDCNGLEKWNRGSWVKKHERMFGLDFVDALYDFSKTIFDMDKAWVREQTERVRALRGFTA